MQIERDAVAGAGHSQVLNNLTGQKFLQEMKMNIQAKIGHNKPPTPFDEISIEINDLYEEAKQWLDGEPITTQKQADALNTLSDAIKSSSKKAEALRKEEVKPLDAEKKKIQDRFNPLIGETKTIKGKTVLALETVKETLKPYLIELDRQQRAEAEKAHSEAQAKLREANEAMQSRQTLEDRERAENLIIDARKAEKAAKKADKAKPQAKGAGRAQGLRVSKVATLLDARAAARWMWQHRLEELTQFMQSEAEKAMRAGVPQIDGFEITEERVLK